MENIDLRQRIAHLQDELNALISQLPSGTGISFGTRFLTSPIPAFVNKRLVIRIEPPLGKGNKPAPSLEQVRDTGITLPNDRDR